MEIDSMGDVAQPEFDETDILAIPFELMGGEELLSVHCIAVVLMLPESGLEANPRSKMEEVLLYPEFAERLEIHHLGVFKRLFLHGHKIIVHPTSGNFEIPVIEARSAVGVLSRKGLFGVRVIKLWLSIKL
jgi:hypothetical protein